MALIHYVVVEPRPTGTTDYARLDAESTYRLFQLQLQEVCEEMRVHGMRIDPNAVESLRAELSLWE